MILLIIISIGTSGSWKHKNFPEPGEAFYFALSMQHATKTATPESMQSCLQHYLCSKLHWNETERQNVEMITLLNWLSLFLFSQNFWSVSILITLLLIIPQWINLSAWLPFDICRLKILVLITGREVQKIKSSCKRTFGIPPFIVLCHCAWFNEIG